MKRDIEDVRRNIASRKKKKVHTSHSKSMTTMQPPQDEELHGFPPIVTGYTERVKRETGKIRSNQLILQLVFSALLFVTVAAGERTNIPLVDKPEQWVSNQLQQEFPFAKVMAWYSDRFGNPLQLVQKEEPKKATDLALPVNGTVTKSFQSDGKGIVMSATDGSNVKAVKAGTVIFAGNDPESDKTVIIQHADGTNTIYGYLSSINVHLYEFVDAQSELGSVKSTEGQAAQFFFAVQKDKQYLDPVQVIKVDENS
ncbi:M23 family metallopeptidase [Halobacillus salinarum]|uniref:M23 family metallopeptidase n=1 Tax=Halobacillus salinarum TaxID=2932257 RepID=A0ABY4EP64_9BACI|nr:M23 family metallopeptidase [Halobacillus salinarum]UOQ46253.1 M23 family metallopeptidase [Halobacillus salinarum]